MLSVVIPRTLEGQSRSSLVAHERAVVGFPERLVAGWSPGPHRIKTEMLITILMGKGQGKN